MDWLDRLNNAVDYIESHMEAKISYDKTAQIACCSTYHFQRMFSFIAGVPISEYIRRRRLTLAAFELQSSDIKVVDVALKYGYESPEAFSRAFKALHGVMPLSARNNGISLKAYPRITFHISIKGDVEMNYRIEQKEVFEVCGITTEISVIGGQNYITIPRFWDECFKNGSISRLHKDFGLDKDACLNAALYNFREGVFSYMICSDTPKTGAPDGYYTFSVPAFTWAVFPTVEYQDGEGAEPIQSVWKRIFPEWFPTSGYEHADGPEFEMYYNRGDGRGYAEVWIPVVKK